MKVFSSFIILIPLLFSFPYTTFSVKKGGISLPSCSGSSGRSGGDSGSSSIGYGAGSAGGELAQYVPESNFDDFLKKLDEEGSTIAKEKSLDTKYLANDIVSEIELRKEFELEEESLLISRLHVENSFTSDLDNLVDDPVLFSLMPKNNKEYSFIYNTPSNHQSIIEINKLNDELNNIGVNLQSNLLEGTPEELYEFIGRQNSKPVVIFGHSENGGKLIVFPNGKKVSASEIHSECVKRNKNCMILTCYGDDFQLNGKISAMEAVSIWKKMKKMPSDTSLKDFREFFVKERETIKLRKNLGISVVATVSAGTFLLNSRDKEKER